MLILTLIGLLEITSYQSVPQQTDSTPFITSTGERVRRGGCAVSRDLMCPMSMLKTPVMRLHTKDTCFLKNRIHYGDHVWVKGYGVLCVNDTMHPRIHRHIDIWVPSYRAEKRIGVQQRHVYRFEERN